MKINKEGNNCGGCKYLSTFYTYIENKGAWWCQNPEIETLCLDMIDDFPFTKLPKRQKEDCYENK